MVALNVPTIKVSINGRAAGGEEWSTGFWCVYVDTDTPTSSQLNTFAGDVLDAFGGVWAVELASQTSGAIVPESCRVHFYPAGSLVSTVTGEDTGTIAAGTSTVTHPYQVGLVCSLRTALATRRGRGRMYLPLTGIPLSAGTGQYNGDEIPTIADAMQAFFNAVNNLTVGGSPVGVVVASHADGLVQPVTHIIIDSIPDVQRRRANQLAASTTATRSVTP